MWSLYSSLSIWSKKSEQMKFAGLLLRESLKDLSILDLIQITKTETWNVGNAAELQPETWTAIYFEGNASQSDFIAEKMSGSLKPSWYINFSTEANNVYVIFPNKVFKYIKGDERARGDAIEYGRSLDIPEHQLDWKE